ncbi:Vacuolar membrane protease [Smittium culicis]|uniref:Peptide hydrolase n=1 Tax=Smittium culicis TaxID=133412 RepID=A0A1R1Y295_9FUNG|nr:Vacuolar membrane protease [Smittium culicis]
MDERKLRMPVPSYHMHPTSSTPDYDDHSDLDPPDNHPHVQMPEPNFESHNSSLPRPSNDVQNALYPMPVAETTQHSDNLNQQAQNHDKIFSTSNEDQANAPILASLLYYFTLFFVYLAIFVLVVLVRNRNLDYTPPNNEYHFFPYTSIISDSTPPKINVTYFRADNAFRHLRFLSRVPHPWNSRENQLNLDYISAVLTQIQQLATENGVKMEVISQDPTAFTFIPKEGRWVPSVGDNPKSKSSYFIEGRNVLARIIGTSEDENNAILLSSHIDSVQVSPGATDDGVNGAVMLEIARHIVFNRLKSTVVFNFNNGEEVGLFGALAFMHHPWSKTVKAFINIEGAGAGGPAMVFRASNYNLINLYGKKQDDYVDNWHPHCNVFANDAFKLGLINSDTDYTVYAAYGIPGLDIAFYNRRSVYHTNRDSISEIPIGSVDQVGNTVLNAVKSMSENREFMKSPLGKTDSSSVYYDVLGGFVITHTFTVLYILYAIIIVIIPGFAFIFKLTIGKKNSREYNTTFVDNALTESIFIPYFALIKGFLFTSLAAIVSLVFSFILGLILTKANYFIVYGNIYIVAITHLFFNLFAVSLVLLLYMFLDGRSKGNKSCQSRFIMSRCLTYSQMFLWWFAAVIGLVLASIKGAGMLYYTIYYSIFCLLSALWTNLVDPIFLKRSFFAYISYLVRIVLSIVIPSILTVDLTVTLINGMGQTVIDGTGPTLVHLLFGLFTTTIVLPSMPFLVTPGKRRLMYSSATSFVVFLALLIACCTIKPFTKDAPSHVYLSGDINLQTKSENFTILSNSKLDPIFKNLKDFKYDVSSTYQTDNTMPEKFRSTWIGDNGFIRNFANKNTSLPSYTIKKSVPDSFTGPTSDKSNGVVIGITAQESYICELYFSNNPVYAYVVPEFLDNDYGIGKMNLTNVLQSNSAECFFPKRNSKFTSYKIENAVKGCCQSLFIFSKFSNTKYQVYAEHDGDGFGDVLLQCHYGEFTDYFPQVTSLYSYVPTTYSSNPNEDMPVYPISNLDTNYVLGSFHSSTGLLTATTKLDI